MENINSVIFNHITDDFIMPTGIAQTYTVLCHSAIDDINWALDRLSENPSSVYATQRYMMGIASLKTATVMLLSAAYPNRVNVFTTAWKVVEIKCKRLGIKPYI